MHAAAVPSVTVEDESTKRCSACGEDRPVSAFSSAQLKKKGKRVCASCVAAKDLASYAAAAASAASARLESMRPAFFSKLSACAPRATAPRRGCRCRSNHSRLAQCDRCKTELCSVQCFDKHPCDANLTFEAKINAAMKRIPFLCLCCLERASRLAACTRCSVECCSLSCFDRHDCDAYVEAKRTMPTELIPEEDRFEDAEEMLHSWRQLVVYASAMPACVSASAVQYCAHAVDQLRATGELLAPLYDALRNRLREFHSPRVPVPWWNPAVCARINRDPGMHHLVRRMTQWIFDAAQWTSLILENCGRIAMADAHEEGELVKVRGSCVPMPRSDIRSVCFLPGRLLHKLLTLVRFIVRAMGSAWMQAHFAPPGDVSSDAFGTLPTDSPDDQGAQRPLGYLELPHPDSGLRTLVPLVGAASAASKFCMLRQHFGDRTLSMAMRDGQLVLDRGLFFRALQVVCELTAVTGWTGNAATSFSVAPTQSWYWSDEWLLRDAKDPDRSAVYQREVAKEIEARKRPDYFHLIPAIKRMIPEDEWPNDRGCGLFIATPQRGIESELVELSLLESLVEDASAGSEHAQLLLSHIESECAAPIAEVISAQKSRLDQMLEDQAAQLRIHAEAVKRAESRARLKAAAVEGEQKADATTAASASSASALAPTSAASSSSSSSSAVSSDLASSSPPGPAYSWTQSREYAGLESLREPGRKKYSTIMSAAKRLLYSLSPVSVNKRGGSHIVFHFASGAPATLVQMHAGARSKDSTAHTTRLFAQLSEVAAQQLGGPAANAEIEGASMGAAASAGAGNPSTSLQSLTLICVSLPHAHPAPATARLQLADHRKLSVSHAHVEFRLEFVL